MFTAPLSPLFYPAQSIINPSSRTDHRLSGHGDSDLSSTFCTADLLVLESGERRGFTTGTTLAWAVIGWYKQLVKVLLEQEDISHNPAATKYMCRFTRDHSALKNLTLVP